MPTSLDQGTYGKVFVFASPSFHLALITLLGVSLPLPLIANWITPVYSRSRTWRGPSIYELQGEKFIEGHDELSSSWKQSGTQTKNKLEDVDVIYICMPPCPTLSACKGVVIWLGWGRVGAWRHARERGLGLSIPRSRYFAKPNWCQGHISAEISLKLRFDERHLPLSS